MKAVDYRKLCSSLRKEIKIIEDNLRRKDYTFDYSKQPSQAMFRYKKAFLRNDGERYQEFLNKVVEQTEKIARGEEIPEAEMPYVPKKKRPSALIIAIIVSAVLTITASAIAIYSFNFERHFDFFVQNR